MTDRPLTLQSAVARIAAAHAAAEAAVAAAAPGRRPTRAEAQAARRRHWGDGGGAAVWERRAQGPSARPPERRQGAVRDVRR